MAKEEAKEEEEDGAEGGKSKGGLIIGIVIGVIMLVGGSAAGALLGPKLLGSEPEPAGSAVAPEDVPPEPLKVVSAKFAPLVIDIRDDADRIHHLKVGLAAELAEGTTPEDFELLVPRGREAALTYLRTLTFEDVAKAERYDQIREELSERVRKAVGENRLTRVLLIDFVAQ